MLARVCQVSVVPALPAEEYMETDDPYVVIVNDVERQLPSKTVLTVESIYTRRDGSQDYWTCDQTAPELRTGDRVNIEVVQGQITRIRRA